MSESSMYKKITKIYICVRNPKQNIHACADVPEDLSPPSVTMKAFCGENICSDKSNIVFIRKISQVSYDFPDNLRNILGRGVFALFLNYNLSLKVKLTKFLGHQLTHSLDLCPSRIGSMCFRLSVFLVPSGMHEAWWVFNKYLFKNV